MAADEAIKKVLAEEKERSERSRAEAVERMKGKPTPTQDENDRAKLGEHISQHEDDGSGPEVHERKEAKPTPTPGTYQTRQARPAPPRSTSE